jgi:hypothetical protein
MPAIDKRSKSAVRGLDDLFSSGVPCLSITNLSDDATPREVHILFSGCPGYVKSYLAYDSNEKRLWGIVHFESEEDAQEAAESRSGTTWDGTRSIRIDLGRPEWMSSKGVELNIVQRDRVAQAGSQQVRQKAELQTPLAQKAYRNLEAAVRSKQVVFLKEAIAEGEAAGLQSSELTAAKDTLSQLNTQRCVRTASSCEHRAFAMMKKALAAVPGSDPLTDDQVETLENAQRVGEEAAQICNIGGLQRGERRMRALVREIGERLAQA